MSRSQHVFSLIPRADIPRSSFNRTHGYKTTFDAGKLIPFYLDEVLPGDTFNCKATIFARLSTLLTPVMDNAYLDIFFFFVPLRLLWRHTKEFFGENLLEGVQSKEYSVPQITYKTLATGSTGALQGSLVDYFGFPVTTPTSTTLSVSAFPFRAYWKIYNDWFRDENLQPCLNLTTGEPLTEITDTIEQDMLGDDRTVAFTSAPPSVLWRGKRHDYFTSALPWPQKGPGVELPIGATAEIKGDGLLTFKGEKITSFADGASYLSGSNGTGATPTGIASWIDPGSETGHIGAVYDSGLVADLSSATAVTINSLRQAFQLQKFYERDARGGSRYTEIIRSHFGVVSPDARLQRSEFLGGSSTPVNINTVVQNSATDQDSPQGNLSAFGVVGTRGSGFTKSFTEHGIVIGLLNIRADLNYQQGINRMWSRQTRVDYYWPAFAHLGEQAVLNKEIYAQGTADDDKVFGYQERFAEYRYHPSIITGKLRSTDPQSLDVWHFAQKFDNLPGLNAEFIEDHASYDGVKRAVAVQDEPQFIADCYIRLKCARPMPVYSVPGLVDHF